MFHVRFSHLKAGIFIISFFFLFTLKVYPDTLVSINDLKFVSDFEKQTFNGFFNDDDENYLALFLSIDPTIDSKRYSEIKEIIGNKLALYKSSSFEKLKNGKKVKKIYKDVHSFFLVKYDQSALFSSIFSNGDYQCVTGTMLYSLIFSALNIPFEIKLLPNHTYLVAYPQNDYIMVETTNPVKGTVSFDEKFKSKYIDYLHDMKLISQSDYETKPLSVLFDSLYNKPEVADMKALASAQYYNKTLYKFQDMKWVEAFENMEKAYLLHPSKTNTYLLLLALSGTLDQVDIKSEDYAGYLALMMRFGDTLVSNDQLFSMFSKMTYHQLDYEGDVDLYDQSYKKILPNVSDSSLRTDISFLYNFERGRLLYNNQNYQDAFPFIETAFSLKPKNSDTENMFLGILNDMVKKSVFSGEGEENVMDKMDAYLEEFPRLKNNVRFKSLYLKFCLSLMDKFYYAKDITKGEKYRIKFEQNYPKRDYNFQDINNTIVHSYSTAARYYFGRGNYRKSRELLKKGLYYVPNNFMLKDRLRALQ